MKRQIPLLIAFLSAITMIVFYFLNEDLTKDYKSGIFDWVRIIGSFALLIGIVNLLRVHFYKIRRGGKEAVYSYILVLSFFIITVSGLIGYGKRGAEGIVGASFLTFDWMFINVLRPLQGTMFSLLAFYVASAAFRSFRAKTKEATFLLVSAFIVMLGRVPVGTMIWDRIPVISNWIMTYPTAGAQTAIMIGAALGAVSVSLKIIIGIERTYLGGDE